MIIWKSDMVSCLGMKSQWDWDQVFGLLVQGCNNNNGRRYCLTPNNVRHLKKSGNIGRWGEANLRQKIIPEYQGIYPGYKFTLTDGRRKLCCESRMTEHVLHDF